jgi:hypothetical protein
MQLVDALRNTLADAIDTDIGATGFVRFYNTTLTTNIASISLANPAFGAAATGTITLDVTPPLQDATPAAGTVGRIGLYQNSTGAAGTWRVLLGVATAGTPDVTMANNVVATTDTVELSSLTITVPAGTPDVT